MPTIPSICAPCNEHGVACEVVFYWWDSETPMFGSGEEPWVDHWEEFECQCPCVSLGAPAMDIRE